MIFLTYNDAYSGIYKSQVIDVCSFFENELGVKTKLVAFVSLRHFSEQRKLIKTSYKNTWVLPMFPKARLWKLNLFTLFFACLFSGQKKIWARGPFACNLSLSLKKLGLIKKVWFDARGAYMAELTEYDVTGSTSLKNKIASIEKMALEISDVQLAVSDKLQQWWKEHYHFTPKRSFVIPCTLSESFVSPLPASAETNKLRAEMGFREEDVVLVYSGSSAGWQSFELVDDFLYPLLTKHPNLRLIFLSNGTPERSKTFKEFGDRILTKWVKPAEVRNILLASDYGILLREKSVTNQVASPVKFAEYLSCGLQVIISEGIGDFSDYVKHHGCGILHPCTITPGKVSRAQKESNNKLALTHFSKHSREIKKGYSYLLED